MTRRSRKAVKIPTPESMAAAALHYLSRYAASEQSLRRTLQNKLRRAALANEAFAADAALRMRLQEEIERIVERHRISGVINDAAFAEMKAGSLRRSGRSRRAIQQKLALKGIKPEIIGRALDAADEGGGADAELLAARKLAKRRRLGVFRAGATSPEQARKDIATMARAGFSIATARRVLGAPDVDDAFDDDF